MVKDIQYTDPSRINTPPPDPELDNDKKKEESASNFVSGLAPIQEHRRKAKRNKNLLIIVVAIAALAAGGYFLLLRGQAPPPEPVQEAAQTETEQTPQVAPTEEYNSTDLQLSLEYPGDWAVDDSEIGRLIITSPETKLKDATGTEVDAKVVFTIVSAGSEVTGFTGASGIAAAESEKISYTKPSQNQRKQTHVTLVSFSGSGVDAVYVTGDNGYQKDQNVPKGDVAIIEPIISVTFEDADGSPVTISSDEWGANPILAAAGDIIKSLRVN